MMRRKLGKLPARPDSIGLKFGMVFRASELPTPPPTFGRAGLIKSYGMFANDDVGDCVWAGAAHETMLWTREGLGPAAAFTDANVLAAYSAVTGYTPSKPATDQGTDMQEAAAYRQKTGITDADGKQHTVDAYMEIRPKDIDQIMLATYLMGAVGFGMQFPSSAEDQFDAGEPWDIVLNSRVEGGHYVPVIDRTKSGNLVVVTWGKEQEMTPAFAEKYCDEAVAYLSLEYLSYKHLSPEGYDPGALTTYFNQLS